MTLYGFESNGDSKGVREALSGLCLSFINVNSCKGSKGAATLASKGKKVPYLEDPNTKKQIQGKQEILKHLKENYCTGVLLASRKGAR